jgi:serine O-acetyltransferase
MWQETFSRIRADYARLAGVLESLNGHAPVALIFHPSFISVFLYRISNHWFRRGHRYTARLFWQLNLLLTGADISEPADLGAGLVIVSPAGIAVMAKAGRNLTLMPLSGLGSEIGRREDIGAGPGLPVLGDDVVIEPHAAALGPVRIGNRVRITALTCVTRDIPDDVVVEGPRTKCFPRRNIA